jgi:hypothetical protein
MIRDISKPAEEGKVLPAGPALKDGGPFQFMLEVSYLLLGS